jgi:hypothetical protein
MITMDITRFPQHRQTAAILNRISDPQQRARRAARIADDARQYGDEVLSVRNEALYVLHVRYGWHALRCAGLVDTSRLALRQAFAGLTFKGLHADVRELSEKEAEQRAKEFQEDWWSWGSVCRTATEIRDELNA